VIPTVVEGDVIAVEVPDNSDIDVFLSPTVVGAFNIYIFILYFKNKMVLFTTRQNRPCHITKKP